MRERTRDLLGQQIFENQLFIGSPVGGDARVVPQRGLRISRDGGGIAPVRIDGNAIGWWRRSRYLPVRRTFLISARRIRTRSHQKQKQLKSFLLSRILKVKSIGIGNYNVLSDVIIKLNVCGQIYLSRRKKNGRGGGWILAKG